MQKGSKAVGCVAGAWRVRSGTGTGFCFKADSAHWERIMLLLDSRSFKDGRWQMAALSACLLKLV
jgi:hypothetical protein